jgi:phage I-like protein
MNTRILNREFQHPADGWYQIEALGNHPNRAASLVQVIDAEAATDIVNRFNADAAAGQLRHGHELLIDHEHFSDQPDQETRAYGWLQELQNRSNLDVAPGIYGRIRWTSTGRTAVDGGDYRFFSTEYDPADLHSAESGVRNAELKEMRPTRLAGLTLTNMNNNRGQKPITNRDAATERGLSQSAARAQSNPLRVETTRAPRTFAGSWEPVDSTKTNTKTAALCRDAATPINQTMKTVCTLLGLSAEADEASVHAAVSKLLNRGDITPEALATLRAEHHRFGETNDLLLGEQLTGLLAEHGITDDKIANRLKPVLTPLKNREERLACLADLGFKAGGLAPNAFGATTRVLNRGAGADLSRHAETTADDKTIAQKIKNRANELKGASPKRAFDDCWNQAAGEIQKS